MIIYCMSSFIRKVNVRWKSRRQSPLALIRSGKINIFVRLYQNVAKVSVLHWSKDSVQNVYPRAT